MASIYSKVTLRFSEELLLSFAGKKIWKSNRSEIEFLLHYRNEERRKTFKFPNQSPSEIGHVRLDGNWLLNDWILSFLNSLAKQWYSLGYSGSSKVDEMMLRRDPISQEIDLLEREMNC